MSLQGDINQKLRERNLPGRPYLSRSKEPIHGWLDPSCRPWMVYQTEQGPKDSVIFECSWPDGSRREPGYWIIDELLKRRMDHFLIEMLTPHANGSARFLTRDWGDLAHKRYEDAAPIRRQKELLQRERIRVGTEMWRTLNGARKSVAMDPDIRINVRSPRSGGGRRALVRS